MSVESEEFGFESNDRIQLHGIRWNFPSEATKSSQTATNSPLVLLHGGGANAHWWDHLAPSLARFRTVYALDFRGHGDSEYPEERRVGAFNDDLESLLDFIGRTDVDLMGHSMGAAVALDHASRWKSTGSLVLIDLARGSQKGSSRRARLALSLRRTYRTREEAAERFQFLPEAAHAAESLREWIAKESIREEPDARFGYKFDPGWFGLPSRPRPDLGTIECPTLLVRGENSQLLSRPAAQEFVASLRSGQLAEIESAGHHVLVDQPERLLEVVSDFYATHTISG